MVCAGTASLRGRRSITRSQPSSQERSRSSFFPGAPAGILFPTDPGIPRPLAPIGNLNFSPRVGLSWSLRQALTVSSARFSVRREAPVSALDLELLHCDRGSLHQYPGRQCPLRHHVFERRASTLRYTLRYGIERPGLWSAVPVSIRPSELFQQQSELYVRLEQLRADQWYSRL